VHLVTELLVLHDLSLDLKNATAVRNVMNTFYDQVLYGL